jgi:hypothetical protein
LAGFLVELGAGRNLSEEEGHSKESKGTGGAYSIWRARRTFHSNFPLEKVGLVGKGDSDAGGWVSHKFTEFLRFM